MIEEPTTREPELPTEPTPFQTETSELEVVIRDEVPFHIPRD